MDVLNTQKTRGNKISQKKKNISSKRFCRLGGVTIFVFFLYIKIQMIYKVSEGKCKSQNGITVY